MFRKLRNKFLFINMSLLSFVFIAIFTVIYISAATSGERQLSSTLDRVINAPPRPMPGDFMMATSLVVDLDKSGAIINSSSFVQMDSKTIKEAVQKALETGKPSANISAGDYHYKFLKQNNRMGIRIAFVDRDPLTNNLTNILLILIFIGSASLIVLFFVSLLLANRTIKPIKEAFEKQQQFIADASHELKTPLTIMRTNLDVVESNEDESIKSQSKWLGFIHSQIDRMSNLINDMLSLAKMDSSEQGACFRDLDLSMVLDGTLLSFEAAVFESDIELKTEIKKGINLYGDKDGFVRVINILMDNAIKNTPEGGSISVNLDSDKSKIKMTVKNTGSGISRENLEKIFERFYRADTSRTRESGGYGLGLAIAKSVVELHHGKIYAQSNLGSDTSFIIELPQGRKN